MLGQCWSIQGSTGYVNVVTRNNLKINFTAAFIEQPLLGPDDDGSASPRDFTVWGLASKLTGPGAFWRYLPLDIWEKAPFPLLWHQKAFVLARGTYDLNAGIAQQVLQTRDKVAALGIPIHSVVFLVESNWGSPNSTCIYRIGAYGNPPTS